MCAYQFIYNTTKLNQLTVSDFIYHGVPNLVFYFKCYNLPFFGWRYYGNVENVLTVLIFLHVIYKCILSQYVQNYRPTHEQTNILLDQLQKHFF